MAISVVWGLSFATVLTLIVIPALFRILEDAMAGGRLIGRVVWGQDS